MKVDFIEKPSITVIGKLGQGKSDQGSVWVPPLWEVAHQNFHDITNLVKRDENGNPIGAWGAMSDVDNSFNPWSDQGQYLAGFEVEDDASAPVGWEKWVIPPYTYAVVKCSMENYGEAFNEILGRYFPENNLELVGAVHEFYSPQESNGDLYLYFPIKKM